MRKQTILIASLVLMFALNTVAMAQTINGVEYPQFTEEDIEKIRIFEEAYMMNFNENNGKFTYKPNKDFQGSDSFEFKVSDGEEYSYIKKVELVINPIRDDKITYSDTTSSPRRLTPTPRPPSPTHHLDPLPSNGKHELPINP